MLAPASTFDNPTVIEPIAESRTCIDAIASNLNDGRIPDDAPPCVL